MENMHIANLAFLLDYDSGTTPEEIEYELYKLAFQTKGEIHYDRLVGGAFENIEQESSNDAELLMLKFGASMVESVYYMNEEKKFDPYVVVGFTDITTTVRGSTVVVVINYRLLQNVTISGQISLEL